MNKSSRPAADSYGADAKAGRLRKPITKRRAVIYFIICVIFEQIGNLFLSYTEGFTVLLPSIACMGGYFFCFFFFGKALEVLNLGVSYAVWGGVSVVFVGILTVTLLHGRLTVVDIIGMTIITLGIIGMDLWGVREAPKESDTPEALEAESAEKKSSL